MLSVSFKHTTIDLLNPAFSKPLVMLESINVIHVLTNIFIHYDVFTSEWFLIRTTLKLTEAWCRSETLGLRKDVIIINNGN